MGSRSLRPHGRLRLVVFALIGNVLPVTIAAATDGRAHRPVFFAGAIAACVASLIVALVPRRRRLAFWGAAFGLIPALTLMQAYSGGAASGYSVLVIIPMVWFGLEATDVELVAGMLVLAACCALPMVLVGAPAYPRSWGHATLLTLIGIAVAGSLRAVTRELAMVAQRFAHEAVVDDLTGLLNRRGWRYNAPRELARAARSGNPITLVTLDLDNFKELNDELGHEQGDRALRDTAERIRATLRAGDVVARLGGDEFVALLTNSTLTGSLTAIDRLRESTPASESFSSGIAVWDRREELSELLRRSDLALYAAKDAGGGCTSVATPQLEPLPAPVDDDDDDGLELGRRASAG
ncbi:MAG TPA: GGDEF domain-containing protein [Solirubrobacteraceae bacterium]|nr:GGDEF domain-containing protein [Solirubrobacteraceae bacterium]